MGNKYKKIALGVLLSLQVTQAMAISNLTAFFWSAMVMCGSRFLIKQAPKYDKFLAKTITIPAAFFASFYLYSQTPRGRFKVATVNLNMNSMWKVLDENDFTSQKEMIGFVIEYFIYKGYPLVQCAEELKIIKDSLVSMKKACFELGDEDAYKAYFKKSINIEKYIEKVDKYTLFIKRSPEYREQFGIYRIERKL